MKTRAYLLFLEDTDVGRAVAVMRRLFQPKARLLPHMTVRFPVHERRVSVGRPSPTVEYYESCPKARVTITGAGTFGCLSRNDDARPIDDKLVVYLECRSLELDAYEYKPDFPDSVFHLTLYEGSDLSIAQTLLAVLREFHWGLDFDVSVGESLVQLQTGRDSPDLLKYAPSSEYLDGAIRSTQLDERGLLGVEHGERSTVYRFEALRHLCKHLHELQDKVPTSSGATLVAKANADVSNGVPLRRSFEDPAIFDGSTYDVDRERDVDDRGRRYLTPPEIAYQTVIAALQAYGPLDDDARFGSPWFGNGVFYPVLCAALRQLSPSIAMNGVAVVDDDDSRERIRKRWAGVGLATIDLGEFIRRGLAADETNKWSIVLADLCAESANNDRECNGHSELELLPSLRTRLRRDLNIEVAKENCDRIGRILLSHFLQRDNAVAAWVVPSTFLQRKFGAALRQYLTRHVQLLRIHRFGRIAYGYAEDAVDQTLLIVRRAKPESQYEVQMSWGESLSTPDSLETLSRKDLECGIWNGRGTLLWRGIGGDLSLSDKQAGREGNRVRALSTGRGSRRRPALSLG
ncbi:MAG: hypothetical protein OXM54_13900 [Acidimicrobiaceae bacterium]|nr:hypothetical protein [Acidimicrobiaceae bacterium]